MLTNPVGMVCGEATARQPGLAALSVTGIPGAGAAVPWPLLSKFTVIVMPKLAFSVAEPCTMLSDAVVATLEVPVT